MCHMDRARTWNQPHNMYARDNATRGKQGTTDLIVALNGCWIQSYKESCARREAWKPVKAYTYILHIMLLLYGVLVWKVYVMFVFLQGRGHIRDFVLHFALRHFLDETFHRATTGSSFRAWKHMTEIRNKFSLRRRPLSEHLRYSILEQLHCVIGTAATAVAMRRGRRSLLKLCCSFATRSVALTSAWKNVVT
jgi:hypothetical protein